MKLFKSLSLAFGILSTTLWAAPKVGDYSTLAGIIASGGQQIAVESRTENIQFDANTGKILVRTTNTSTGNPPQIEEEWKAANEILDQDMAPALAQAFCQQNAPEAKLESVETPVGTFETCKVPVNDNGVTGFMWVGPVPSGLVKISLVRAQDGLTYESLLKEFAWR